MVVRFLGKLIGLTYRNTSNVRNIHWVWNYLLENLRKQIVLCDLLGFISRFLAFQIGPNAQSRFLKCDLKQVRGNHLLHFAFQSYSTICISIRKKNI